MAKGDSKKSVADIIKAAQKKYDLQVGSMSDILDMDVAAVSTGSMSIDSAIGVGGMPRGRTAEFYGLPASGKTTCALETVAQEQKRIIAEGTDEYILYLDYEHALDPKFVRGLGVDMSHKSFLLAQPVTFEDGAEIAKELIGSGAVRLAVWDSVASMVPKAVWEADEGKALIAPLARVFGQFLMKLNPLLHENNCSAIFINHLKEKIDANRPAYMGPAETTPGGVALKFYCSVRLKFQEVKSTRADITDAYGTAQKVKISSDIKVTVTKNKVGSPFRQAMVRIRYGKGFDDSWSALSVLLHQKQLKKMGGYYYFDKLPDLIHEDMTESAKGEHYILTEEGVLSFADEHPEWREKFIARAREVVARIGADALVETTEPVDDEGEDDLPSESKRVSFERE